MERIERLIRLNVEIEGLLRVLSYRDNSTVREMLKEKHNDFSAHFCELMSELPKDEDVEAATVTSEAVITEKDEEKSAETAEKMDEPESAEEKNTDVVEEVCENNKESDSIENVDESIPKNEIVPVELGDFPAVNEQVKEPIMPPEIRVDEMIARRTAGDLTKAFTLNDKIRFRRSLFASDADEFARVLSDLSDIDTYRQATNFLTDVLGWDMNNPEVEEFLTIIRPHYPKAD